MAASETRYSNQSGGNCSWLMSRRSVSIILPFRLVLEHPVVVLALRQPGGRRLVQNDFATRVTAAGVGDQPFVSHRLGAEVGRHPIRHVGIGGADVHAAE